MKKLVNRPVEDDNFAQFVRLSPERTLIAEGLAQFGKADSFPRKVLMDMTFAEIFSTWTRATQLEAKGLAGWLHKSFSPLITVFHELNSLHRRTTGIVPDDWHARSMKDVIASGGRMNEVCVTPEGNPGQKHTLPGLGLTLVVSSHSGNPLWYEKL